jgi:hypothetical protein
VFKAQKDTAREAVNMIKVLEVSPKISTSLVDFRSSIFVSNPIY